MVLKKDVVCGLGEIGTPILKLISKGIESVGYDVNPKLVNNQRLLRLEKIPTELLHICIPYGEKFEVNTVDLVSKFKPSAIVIHSTIRPGTTEKLQKRLQIPVIYSATRGVHKRMLTDLKRYAKFYSVYDWAPKSRWAKKTYENRMKKIGIKTKTMSNPLALELAKIVVDTSYYGWLINYAQLSNMIAIQNNVDYDEMWSFADEIHKYLGNRPKMFPGFIGGHCLDENEIVFIKTSLGMKPTTIREYVDKDYANDILSYDQQNKKPFFDKVTAKWKRKFSGIMVTLTARTNRSITTTDEHIMLVSNDLSERFAKQVKTEDYIPFMAQLPELEVKQSFDFESKNWRLGFNMPRLITITEDFCRLLGYYVAEGSISNYGKGYSVIFSFNKNETIYISDVCRILESMGINYYTTTQNNVTHVGVKSIPLSLFIADTLGCGRNSNTKCLPEFIYFTPRKMKEEFLCGYFKGDDSFAPEIRMVQAGTSSRILAAGLDILLLSMGYVMTLTENIHCPSVIDGRIIKGGLLYSLVSKKETQYNDLASVAGFSESQITRNHNKNLWHVINKNLYMIRTTKTVHQESEQDVYSIDTKNHLFVSSGGRLIHNCVIPNLDLMKDDTFNLIKEINFDYAKILKKRQAKGKKY
jgi:intein/homing endonuclease